MIIQGTVYSWETSNLVFVSKTKTGLTLIFKNVDYPVNIDLSTDKEINRQYDDILKAWGKPKMNHDSSVALIRWLREKGPTLNVNPKKDGKWTYGKTEITDEELLENYKRLERCSD